MSIEMEYRVLMERLAIGANLSRTRSGKTKTHFVKMTACKGMDNLSEGWMPDAFRDTFRRVLHGEDVGYYLDDVTLVPAGVMLTFRNHASGKHVVVGPHAHLDLRIELEIERGKGLTPDIYDIGCEQDEDSDNDNDYDCYPRVVRYRGSERLAITFQEDGYALIEETR